MDRKIGLVRKLKATFDLTSALFSFFFFNNSVRAFASIVRKDQLGGKDRSEKPFGLDIIIATLFMYWHSYCRRGC